MVTVIQKIARWSAIIGGVVLTLLALLMTVSICGGFIAKIGNSDWAMGHWPSVAETIQNSGIRTIPGMYEIVKYGIAFVIFAFLPITSLDRAHAVVDVFTNFLPPKLNQVIISFWSLVFFIVFVLITWRLFYGMERMMSSHMISVELKIPEWWGYLVAFLQMLIVSFVSGYVALVQFLELFKGDQILPETDGAAH